MENKKQGTDWIKGGILCIITAVVPIIVKMVQLHPRADEYGVVRAQWNIVDAFSYYKMSVIMILSAILALYSLTDMWGREPKKAIKRPENFIPLAFLLLSLVSAIVSPYKTVAFYGASERFEGFWMWAAYMLLFVEARIFTDSKKSMFTLLSAFSVGALLVGGIGFLQYIGKNPYDTEFVKKLVMGSVQGSFSMRFTSVFSTLYNPNCVGIYTGMLCPLFLITGIAAPIKKWYKYVLLALAALMLVNMLGCESVGGFLGFLSGTGFAVLVSIVYLIKKLGKKGIVAAAVCVICLAAGAAIILSGNSMIAQKADIIRQTIKNPQTAENPFFFKNISKLDDNTTVITVETGDVLISAENGKKKVAFSENGSEIRILEMTEKTPDSGFEETLAFDVPGVAESSVSTTSDGFMQFKSGDGKNFTSFYFDISDGNLVYTDMFSNPIDLDAAYPSFGFKGMERLGSNRGYIWSRSIPLIAKNIIIGAGPDCYVFKFPQKDVLSKLKFLGNPNVIIDKPHSFYLQVAINSGLISLMLLIALFVIYIAKTVVSVLKCKNYMLLGIRLGAAAGVIGYLASVTTTDSVVSVSPLFWILLGLGFAANNLEINDEE